MASIYLRGKTWWVWYNDPKTGEKVQRSLKTQDKKEAKLAKQKIEYLTAHGKRPLGSAPKFGEYVIGYLAWYETQYPDSYFRAAGIVKNHLNPEFSDVPLDQIGPSRFNVWVSKRLKTGIVSTTLAKEAKQLKAILNHAVDEEVIDRNPLAGKKGKLPKSGDDSVPGHYDKDQLDALYAKSNPTHAAIWRLLANTGLRRGEAYKLRIAKAVGDQIIVESTHKQKTKGKKTRVIPLNAQAKAARDFLLKDNSTEFLLPRINVNNMTHNFANCAKRAGLPGSIHWLRHSFATNLLLANVPIRVVQELLGHSSIELTIRYSTHLKPEALTAAVEKLTQTANP